MLSMVAPEHQAQTNRLRAPISYSHSRRTNRPWIYGVIVLLLSSGAVLGLFRGQDRFGLSGDPVKQYIWLGIYVWAGIALFLQPRIRAASKPLLSWGLAVVVVAAASMIWSIDPTLTARRVVALSGTVLVGLYLGVRYDSRRLIELMAITAGLASVGSIVLWFISPPLATFYDGRGVALAGLYTHKNALGAFGSWGLVTSLIAATNRSHRGAATPYIITGLVCAAGVFASKSVGAWLVTAMMLGVFTFIRSLRSMTGRTTFATTVVVTIAVVLFGYWAVEHTTELASEVGRDATLSGRTDIWSAALSIGRERPLGGYGYGTWDAPAGIQQKLTPLLLASEGVFAEPTHAHNAFITSWLQLGLLGVVLAVCQFLVPSYFGIKAARTTGHYLLRLGPLLFACFGLLYGLAESNALLQNDFFTIASVSLAVSCAREYKGPDVPAGGVAH